MVYLIAFMALVLAQVQVRASGDGAFNHPARFRLGLLPRHNFALLASITMRAIVMDSEMMDCTRELLF
jgi:hypothetical protein